MIETAASSRFPQALREAIEGSGLTLETLQRRLSERGLVVGRSTLSYWQNGHRLPTGVRSLAVIDQLEQILKVPDGHLRGALSLPAPPGGSTYSILSVGERLHHLFAEMGCRDDFEYTESIGHVNLGRLGPLGELQEMDTILSLRAMSDIDRYPLLHAGERGGDPHLLRLQMKGGGRIGRLRHDLEANVIVAEVIYDRQVRRGETHLLHYSVHDANPLPADCYFILLNNSRAFIALQMTFHPDRLPVQIEEFEKFTDTGPGVFVRNRTLGLDHKVSLVRERARRGVVGLRWTFAE